MTTLHIQLPVADLAAFKTGFADHDEIRRKAGVRTASVRTSLDDPSLVVIDLDFSTSGEAEAFLGYLRETVWKDNARVLAGTPEARILEPLDLG